MNKPLTWLEDEGAFTIIEVMVAIFVLLLGVLGAVTMLNTANASTQRNQARNGATNLVRDIVEASRSLPYSRTAPTVNSSGQPDATLQTALQGMTPTSGGSSFRDADPVAAGWQIVRRGVRYTVTVAACVVDDPKDKVVASHSPANADGTGYYCPNLPSTPTGDANGDDYRRVAVTAAWTSSSCNACGSRVASAGAKTYSVSQTAVIINPSGGLGPSPTGPITSDVAVWPVTRTISVPVQDTAVGVEFTVNDPAATDVTVNTPSSTDPAHNTATYSFTYSPATAPPDNTYTVFAQAFNSIGQFGRQAIANLVVNGVEATPPTGLTGGFDWRRCLGYPLSCNSGERVFDLEWNPSTSADVIAYYVYRVNGVEDWKNQTGDSADTLVSCIGRPSDTTHPGPGDFLEAFTPACADAGVPAQPGIVGSITGLITVPGTTATYYVRAVDPDPSDPTGATRRLILTNHSGSYTVTENMLNVRPTTPILSITNAAGFPCLSWTNSLDVDALGNSIVNPVRFYRIYRDSTAVGLVDTDPGAPVVNLPDPPYSDRIARAAPNQANSCDTANPSRSYYLDTTVDPSQSWNYYVTAVDQDYLESFASLGATWTPPSTGP